MPDNGTDVTVELEPRFDGKQLRSIAGALGAVLVVLLVVAWLAAKSLGLFETTARGENLTRVLGNTVAVWLALAGVVVLFIGTFAALADLRKPRLTTPAPPAGGGLQPTGLATQAIGAVAEGLGKAFANLKGAAAIIVAGLVLLVMSGLIALDSLPDAPCESDLETTSRTENPPGTIVSAESTTKGIGPCDTSGGSSEQPPTTETDPGAAQSGDGSGTGTGGSTSSGDAGTTNGNTTDTTAGG
jgi:hypothetical protein